MNGSTKVHLNLTGSGSTKIHLNSTFGFYYNDSQDTQREWDTYRMLLEQELLSNIVKMIR